MCDARNFVARLAIAGKGFSEIKTLTHSAYGDQGLKKTQIYSIMKIIKDRGGHQEKKRNASLIADIAA